MTQHEWEKKLDRQPREDAWKQRQAVGRWWRIKIAQDNQDTAMYRRVLGDQYMNVMGQIAADIDHSDLLHRLLSGEEPREL